MLNYKIQNNKGFLRWINYKDFIKNIYNFGDNKNYYAILTINFNNSQNIINILNYFNDEEKSNIDLIIVENSYKKDEKQKLQNYIKENNFKNIIIIETIENLGSAGGYALGLEYIFTKNYKNIFIFEDDVLLLEKNTFSEMIKKSFDNNIVYINGPINTGCNKSWLVQIGLYPIDFLKKVGIPNPTYFTRSDDLELVVRFDIITKKYGYEEKIIDKNYFHPYLKKNNGQTWWIYFSIRNHLYTTFKWFKLNNFSYLIIIFFYIWYGFSKILIENNNYVIKSVFYAIFDFIIGDYSFKNNLKKLEKFRKLHLKYPKNEVVYEYNIENLNKITKDKYLLLDLLLFNADRKKVQYSKNIKNFFSKGVLIGGYFSLLYPLFMLSKNIISINEHYFENDLYQVSIIENKPKYIKIILSFIIALIVFIIILPLILIKFFYVFVRK